MKDRLVLVAASTSTPIIIPLSIRTAAKTISIQDAEPIVCEEPTEWIEVEWDVDALLHMIMNDTPVLSGRWDCLDREGV